MAIREIIFRAKTKDGEWVYGCYYKQKQFYGEKAESDCIIVTDDILSNDLGLNYEEVIPETVGQFTGLTDKNGKKIFEGDIVVKNEWYREMSFIVKYDQSRGGYFPFASGDGCGCCETETITPNENGQVNVEVIGNIFDKGNENE